MRNIDYHFYLSDIEYHHIISSLVELKNALIAQGRYTDAVDDVLCKFIKERKKRLELNTSKTKYLLSLSSKPTLTNKSGAPSGR